MGPNVRGISFEIPNEYGEWLINILKPILFKKYTWQIGSGEEYKLRATVLVPLFPDDVSILKGEELLTYIDTVEPQYIIFADLKAFPAGSNFKNIKYYKDFVKSDCELILLIVDSVYTSMYCKDPEVLNELYINAESLKVHKLAYITADNDFRNKLSVW